MQELERQHLSPKEASVVAWTGPATSDSVGKMGRLLRAVKPQIAILNLEGVAGNYINKIQIKNQKNQNQKKDGKQTESELTAGASAGRREASMVQVEEAANTGAGRRPNVFQSSAESHSMASFCKDVLDHARAANYRPEAVHCSADGMVAVLSTSEAVLGRAAGVVATPSPSNIGR